MASDGHPGFREGLRDRGDIKPGSGPSREGWAGHGGGSGGAPADRPWGV